MLFVIFLSSFSKSTIDAEHMNILLLAERKVLFFFFVVCVCSYVGLWRERARKSGYVLEQLLDQEFTFKRIAILLRKATTAVDLKKYFQT